MTENISTSGVRFRGDRGATVGQRIELTMTLPRRLIVVGGHGVVVRVEPGEGGDGVAVRFEELSPLPGAG